MKNGLLILREKDISIKDSRNDPKESCSIS